MHETAAKMFIRVHVDTETLPEQYPVRCSALCLWIVWYLARPGNPQAQGKPNLYAWNKTYLVYQGLTLLTLS